MKKRIAALAAGTTVFVLVLVSMAAAVYWNPPRYCSGPTRAYPYNHYAHSPAKCHSPGWYCYVPC